VQAESAIVGEAYAILNSTGRAKAATYAQGLGSRYLLASRVLGTLGIVGGVIGLGLTLYDVYNMIRDHANAQVTIPSNSASDITGTNLTEWGVATGLSCSDAYNPSGTQQNCPTYGWRNIGSVWYWKTANSCSYKNNANYKEVGFKLWRTPAGSMTFYSSCSATDGTTIATYQYQETFYFVVATDYTATGAYVGPSETAIPDSRIQNTAEMQQTIVNAIESLQSQHAEYQRQISGITTSTSPLTADNSPQGVIDYLQQLQPYVAVVNPTDYTPKQGGSPDVQPEPTLPGPDQGQTSDGDPPDISDGTCTAYEPANNWEDISSEITAAMANIPIMALVDKLSDFPSGSSGTPHSVSIAATSFTPAVTIDLDEWYFNEVLAVMRWAMLCGAFIVSWRIAVGGG
jgi:hypothetical protein